MANRMSRQNRELIALEADVRRFGLWRWRCLVVKVASDFHLLFGGVARAAWHLGNDRVIRGTGAQCHDAAILAGVKAKTRG